MAIEAVIFDWGGVLIDDIEPALISYWSTHLKASPEAVRRTRLQHSPDYQKGVISEAVYWEMVCSALGVPIPAVPSLHGEAFQAAYSPKRAMFSLAARLQGNGYKTGLLSNAELLAMEFFQQQSYRMFDVAVFSCVERLLKPEREIYVRTCERLGVPPEKAFFLDDRTEYVTGAQKAGLRAAQFQSYTQITQELEKAGIPEFLL